ncbi:MAG: hypothetical protein HY874_09615 [Chloroflexi bacterium]|nr:hypothetical protein [Chloroflexota bacterium]
MDWNAVSAVATVTTGVVASLALIAVYWQLSEMRRATYAQGFVAMMEFLQNEPTREERRALYDLGPTLRDRPPQAWTPEEVLTVERVCHKYNSLALMYRYGMLPREVSRRYNDAVAKSWEIGKPLVRMYQSERGKEWWMDLEWMGEYQLKLRRRLLNHT